MTPFHHTHSVWIFELFFPFGFCTPALFLLRLLCQLFFGYWYQSQTSPGPDPRLCNPEQVNLLLKRRTRKLALQDGGGGVAEFERMRVRAGALDGSSVGFSLLYPRGPLCPCVSEAHSKCSPSGLLTLRVG